MIKFYKILTLILQPISFIVLAMSIPILIKGLSTPQLLIGGVAGICVFLYLFFSFRFLIKAVIGNQPVKTNLKDRIRVNSYVTLVQGLVMLFFVMTILFIIPKAAFDEALKTSYNMVVTQYPTSDLLDYTAFAQTMRTTFAIVGVTELVLLIHIFLGWRMLKGYRAYFSE